MRANRAALATIWRIAIPLLAGCMLAGVARAATNEIPQAATELRTQYVAELEKLAKWCEANGLTKEAEKTRRLVTPSDPYKLYVPVLPEVGQVANLSSEKQGQVGNLSDGKAGEWDARLGKLRHAQAVALFDLARRAVRTGRAGLAFDLALDSLQVDPDYEPARRLFGYQKFRDHWRTAYEVKKLRAGNEWSEKFGWLPKAQLRRYEAGQRFCDGRWISAAEDARRHADIASGWNVETEHYTIRTNHSIEAAVSLGVKLERLYRLWQQLFVRYYASQADVAGLFDGRAKLAPPQRRHEVWYFRDRDDYNRALRAATPNIEITAGIYFDHPSRAYFFAGGDDNDRTLYHEATHQLFHESRPVAEIPGRNGNFWILEGIAMFMESLRQEDGYYVLGGFDDQRLHAAKYRFMHDHFYVPLGEFVDFGMERLQKDPRIARLYSQSAGLTHFLIFFDDGRYRDALVSYLVALYAGRDDHNMLLQLTGADSYDSLDKQYRKFIEEGI